MPNSFRQNNTGFDLTYEKDGVYLTVYKSVDFSSRVNEAELISILNRKRIKNYNAKIVTDAIRRSDGKPVKIAEPQEEAIVDASIDVIVSEDKMQAYVKLSPPVGDGLPPTVEGIVQALYSKGVVFGMIEDRIRGLAENPVYNQQVLVAEGIPAVNGTNGRVNFLVDIKKDRKPTIQADGTVNYKDMDLIENITAGQKLAELVPPVPGKPGKNIVGTVLKAIDGKPAILPRGRNVVPSEDGQELYSAIDGQLLYADGKISVFATHDVKANVDNSTGNIKFIGNVVVRGNVLSGFEVEAGGNIEVDGVVEGAILKAGGNIILRRGMHGNGKGMLIAGGDIVAKYIESSTVEAKGNINAEAIMHSNIKCGNNLVLGGRKGFLVGGTARVGSYVELKYLGSQMSTITILEVGVDPEIRERLKFLKTDIVNMEDGHTKASQAVTLLNKMSKVSPLSPEKREILAKSTRAKFYYEKQIMDYRKEIAEIEELVQKSAAGRIKVYNSVYPGVRVAIGNSLLYIKEEAQYCTLYSDGSDIRIGPL